MPLPPTTVARLLNQHEMLETVLNGLHPEDLHAVIVPGKWTIHEQIAHLTCYQPTFL